MLAACRDAALRCRRHCASSAKGKTMKAGIKVLIALVAPLALAACDYLPLGYTPIKDIVTAPANFEGKEVKLKGRVTDITKLPILELKSFRLQDDTGQITVTTEGN